MSVTGDNGSRQKAPIATVSQRLDRLPATRSIWKLVALLSGGLFFEIYDLFLTAYVAPSLITGGFLTTSGVANFIAALFSGLFIATLLCGFLSDRFGRRAIFTYALLWYSIATLLMAFQNTPAGLNFWRFVAGMGLGVEIITIGAYITELVPKAVRGRAFALNQAVGFTAVPIVAFLAYQLTNTSPFGLQGWRWVVLIGSAGAIVIWWIRRGLPESPRWLAQQGRIVEAEQILSELERRVQAEYGRPLPDVYDTEPAVAHRGFREVWGSAYRRRTIMMSAAHACQSIPYYGFASWIPTLLISQGITVTKSLLYTGIIALAAPVGPLIGLLIADRFERKTVIVVTAALHAALGLLFSQAAFPAAILACGAFLTIASNIISYSIHTYQQEIFPTGVRSTAAGFVYSWSRFSAIFSGFMIAFVLRRFAVEGVFLLLAAAQFVFILMIGLAGPRTNNMSLETISR
jgi:putative MFS transporter